MLAIVSLTALPVKASSYQYVTINGVKKVYLCHLTNLKTTPYIAIAVNPDEVNTYLSDRLNIPMHATRECPKQFPNWYTPKVITPPLASKKGLCSYQAQLFNLPDNCN